MDDFLGYQEQLHKWWRSQCWQALFARDKAAGRLSFSIWLDQMVRDGHVTEERAQDIDQPPELKQ